MKGCLSVGVPIAILAAIGVYSAFPHPTYDDTTLKAVATESRKLIATQRANRAERYANLPKAKWPPAIASLKPQDVTVTSETVDITTKPFFDGGWGYGFALDKRDLGMLPECWDGLGHDVYWHGRC